MPCRNLLNGGIGGRPSDATKIRRPSPNAGWLGGVPEAATVESGLPGIHCARQNAGQSWG